MSRGFTSSYRTALLAGLVLAMFGAIGFRLVWLHVIDRDEFLRAVEESRRAVFVTHARRGDILDAKGAFLATSRSVLVLGVDPSALRAEDERKWPRLAALIGRPEAELRQVFTTRFRSVKPKAPSGTASATAIATAPGTAPAPATAPAHAAAVALAESSPDETVVDEPDAQGNRPIRWVKLSDQITEPQYDQITQLGIHGVYGTRVWRRDYPNNQLAAHLIGYIDRQQHPIAGMEHYADFYLRGQDGWTESEKDGKSRELAQFRTREVPAANGYSVVLTIDSTVQHLAEEELAQVAAQYQPLKATIVVSDPRTGFILALANYPTFDLNDYNELPRDEQGRMRNVAVADQYEPGSVFKIVAAAGALNEGLVTPESTFDCMLTKIDYNGLTRNLPRENVGDNFDHPLSVAEIIARSSNRGAAQLAMRLGDRRFYDYARAFGFGQRTGFPMGGETPGAMRPPERWDSLTITRMPMGQSVAASVLQMHQAMEVIASGGVLLRPQLIAQIRDAQGAVVYRFDRTEVRRVIAPATARTMARLLMGVASKAGTAESAEIPGYEVAGKTGTAQKLMPVTTASGATVLRYSERHHVASFVGFLPASRPQLDISVIIDDADAHCPGGVAYGAKVAAPVFKRLAERLIAYEDIRPPVGTEAVRTLALGGVRR
jgi:cell division protein FtsI/penicillin-binding protein 2